MDTEPIPAKWDAISTPEMVYFFGMGILECNWKRTQSFADDPLESDSFHEFAFWRKISVIWACATIEAFVNAEGTAWLGERFYKDNVERLSLEQKIYVLYALKYRTRLPRKLGRLDHVTRLLELRGQLVHPKTTEVCGGGHARRAREMEIDFMHLRKVVNTVTALFAENGIGEGIDEEAETVATAQHIDKGP